jgi:hypothetical protein
MEYKQEDHASVRKEEEEEEEEGERRRRRSSRRAKSRRNAIIESRTSLDRPCACRMSMELRNVAAVEYISTASRQIAVPLATVSFARTMISNGAGPGTPKAHRAGGPSGPV